jgi:hypothetical protein
MEPESALRHSPAAERNRQPILEQLRHWLPASGLALEIASGTGQHATHFAAGLPAWTWLPTDADPAALASIRARRHMSEANAPGHANLLAPRPLDVMAWPWPIELPLDAIFCANLLHIAPWATCAALMRGAAHLLQRGGQLIVYGPFRVGGIAMAQGNVDFDADLRARNPAWGLRLLADVEAEAARAGLALTRRAEMPANNSMLQFVRRPDAGRG